MGHVAPFVNRCNSEGSSYGGHDLGVRAAGDHVPVSDHFFERLLDAEAFGVDGANREADSLLLGHALGLSEFES